jgi:hypothetical protein
LSVLPGYYSECVTIFAEGDFAGMLVEWAFGAFLASGVMEWRGDNVHRFNIAGTLPFFTID